MNFREWLQFWFGRRQRVRWESWTVGSVRVTICLVYGQIAFISDSKGNTWRKSEERVRSYNEWEDAA